jgi:hypothetical protein
MIAQPNSVNMHWPHIGLADKMVSDKRLPDGDGKTLPSLREEVATPEGLCYVKVVRPFHDGTYLARVATSLDLLEREPATIVLTEEHLRYTLPLDTRTEGLCPARLRTLLHSHATAVQPLKLIKREQPVDLFPTPLVDLSPMEAVTVTTSSEMFAAVPTSQTIEQGTSTPGVFSLQKSLLQEVHHLVGTFPIQQAFLEAVLVVLAVRLHQERDEAQKRELRKRHVLVERVQQWYSKTQQQVVHALPKLIEQGRVVWQVSVGVPVSDCLVA